MRRTSIVGLAAVVVAVAAVGVAAIVRRAPPWVAAAPARIPVTVAVAAQGDVPIEFDGIGRVQAFNTVDVRSQVSGRIDRIAFREGQAVAVGDLLVQIDPRNLETKLEQDQANLARDQAHLVKPNASLSQPHAKEGSAAGGRFDAPAAAPARINATIESDQAVIDRDKVELGYTAITAPIAGVTGFRLVNVGNIIRPTDAKPIVTIAQLQPIAVLFPLSQANLAELQEKMNRPKKDPLTVEAWSRDGAMLLDRGELSLVDNKTDAGGALRAEFPNQRRLLWPGEFVQARLILEIRRGGLMVPQDVVQQGLQGAYVWVVNRDETVSRKPVKVSQERGGRALIESGLSAGQQVVENGQYGLYPGARVVVRGSNGETSAR